MAVTSFIYFAVVLAAVATSAPTLAMVLPQTNHYSNRLVTSAPIHHLKPWVPSQRSRYPNALHVASLNNETDFPAPACNFRSFADWWNQQELKLMRFSQQIPGLHSLSLAVHYSLMPHVVTPALAMIAWLVSLPAAASLICFVCAQDVINTAIKWAIQRPRPLWYSSDTDLAAKCGSCTWEADFSFPSAHTQFFSGLAFCSCMLSGSCSSIHLGLASVIGVVIGMTRNYLGVHWPTDTMFGLLLGAISGFVWGKYDPYAWVLQRESPVLSVGVATLMTGALSLLLVSVRSLVLPVDQDVLARYCVNANSSFKQTGEQETHMLMPRPRQIRSKISMLVTIWCTLAYTALCPVHLPTAMVEPLGSHARLTQAIIGIGGLGSFGLILKRALVQRLNGHMFKGKGTASLLKGLAYAGICAWTFLLSQLASHRVMALLG